MIFKTYHLSHLEVVINTLHNQVGFVPASVLEQLQKYPKVFTISQSAVTISEELQTPEERNKALENVLLDLRKQNIFEALRGWRDECYDIKEHFSSPALFKMERSATPLFGLRQYGIHINGFVRHSTRGSCLWLQRRSPTKQTYPGSIKNIANAQSCTMSNQRSLGQYGRRRPCSRDDSGRDGCEGGDGGGKRARVLGGHCNPSRVCVVLSQIRERSVSQHRVCLRSRAAGELSTWE